MFAVLIYFWKLQMSFLSPLSPEKILAFCGLIRECYQSCHTSLGLKSGKLFSLDYLLHDN